MNKYLNLTLENIDDEHICCAIGDKKHQVGVEKKKEWIKNKLKDGHVFRKLDDRGKIFIEYEPIETAWVPVSKKKKPFLGEKKFFEHYGFKVVDVISDYELMALKFKDIEFPKFNEKARTMKIDDQDFTIYYSNECPYVEYEVKELSDYAQKKNIKINFIKIDSLEKAKNVPCIFNNWANFYKGEFISNTILNANAFEKLLK